LYTHQKRKFLHTDRTKSTRRRKNIIKFREVPCQTTIRNGKMGAHKRGEDGGRVGRGITSITQKESGKKDSKTESREGSRN